MAEEKKPETRRKRLKGKSLGDLRTEMKRAERSVIALNDCRDEILDAHDAFKDQVNWHNYIIYDKSEVVDKVVVFGEPIGRITKTEEKKERALRKEMESADREVGDLLWKIAEKLCRMPKDIDPASGEIKGTPVDGVDPDEEQPAEDLAEEATDAAELAEAPEGEAPVPLKMSSAK